MSITVCSRVRDQKSKVVPKYENLHGRVIQTMPVRELNSDTNQLSLLAKFIFEKMDGFYLGGFHTKPNTVFVKCAVGSQFKIDVQTHGLEIAESIYKVYNIDKAERASYQWLFFSLRK